MKTIFKMMTLGLMLLPLVLQAQVLNHDLLPLNKTAEFYTYADTVNQTFYYSLGQRKSDVETLIFRLDTEKVSKNFSMKINQIDLSVENPIVSVKADGVTDLLIQLIRKESKAAFIDTTHVQVLSDSDILLHDLFFMMHSNKPLKRVFTESCVSVYCPHCVVQHVVYEELSGMYPDLFNGVALHVKLSSTTDPLTDFPYWEKLYDKAGVPFIMFDRSESYRGSENIRPVNASAPNGLSLSHFKNRMNRDLFTGLTGSAVYRDAEKNNFEVRGAMTFYAPTETKNYTVGVAVIENYVQGDSEQYNQKNSVFSGGGKGIMGGFEKLPPVIPYTDMVYHQVARGFLPIFSGVKTNFPESVEKGERIEFSLNLGVPASVSKHEHARIILVVFNEAGRAINSLQMPIRVEDPVANEAIALPELCVESLRGGIIVSGMAGKKIRVYSIQGYLLEERVVDSDEAWIALPSGAAVVVTEGMKPKKVMVG